MQVGIYTIYTQLPLGLNEYVMDWHPIQREFFRLAPSVAAIGRLPTGYVNIYFATCYPRSPINSAILKLESGIVIYTKHSLEQAGSKN